MFWLWVMGLSGFGSSGCIGFIWFRSVVDLRAFRACGVDGFMGYWAQWACLVYGLTGLKVYGLTGSGRMGLQVQRLRLLMGLRVYGFADQGFRVINGPKGVWVCGFSGVRVYGFTGLGL